MAARRLVALLVALWGSTVAVAQDAPLTLHLVIDESQSMQGSKARYTVAAVQTVVALVPDGTRVAIVGFGEDARKETDGFVTIRSNADRESLRDTVAAIKFNGKRTNYLAPLLIVNDRIPGGEADAGVTLVVFLSDGEDNVNRRGKWNRVVETAEAVKAKGARLETIYLESKGFFAWLFSSPKRNRGRMIKLAGGGGELHPIVGDPEQLVDELARILRDVANYTKVGLDESFGRTPEATVSHLILFGFPPSRRRHEVQLLRGDGHASLRDLAVYPYPAAEDDAQGLVGGSSLIKIFRIPRPGDRRWALRPTTRREQWKASALERRAVTFEYVEDAPRLKYDLARETVSVKIRVTAPASPSPQALLKALGELDARMVVPLQTAKKLERMGELPASRWFHMVPIVRDEQLLLVPDTPQRDGRLPTAEAERILRETRAAKDRWAKHTCFARIAFGKGDQRGDIPKKRTFEATVTVPPIRLSSATVDLGIVTPGQATEPKALTVSCEPGQAAHVTARAGDLVCAVDGRRLTIAASQLDVKPGEFRLSRQQSIEIRLRCPADALAGPYEGTLDFTEKDTGETLGSCQVKVQVAIVVQGPKRIALKGIAAGEATLSQGAAPLWTTNSPRPLTLELQPPGDVPGTWTARFTPDRVSAGKPARLEASLRDIPPSQKPGTYQAKGTWRATLARDDGAPRAVASGAIAIVAEIGPCALRAGAATLGPAVAGAKASSKPLPVETDATVPLKLSCKAPDLVGPANATIPAARVRVTWEPSARTRKGSPAKATVHVDLRHPRDGDKAQPFPPGKYSGTLAVTSQGPSAQVPLTVVVSPIALTARPAALSFPAALPGAKTQAQALIVSTNTPDAIPVAAAASDLTTKAGARIAARRVRATWADGPDINRDQPAEARFEVDLSHDVIARPDGPRLVRPVKAGAYEGTITLSAPGCKPVSVPVKVLVSPVALRVEPEALDLGRALAGGAPKVVPLTVSTNSPNALPVTHAAGALKTKGGATIPPERIKVEWAGKPTVQSSGPLAGKVHVDLSHQTTPRPDGQPIVRRIPPGAYTGAVVFSAPGCPDVTRAVTVEIEEVWLKHDPPELGFGNAPAGKTTPALTLTVSTNSPAPVALRLAASDLVGERGRRIPADRVRAAWGGDAAARAGKPAKATVVLDLSHQTVVVPDRDPAVRQIPGGAYTGEVTVSADGFKPLTAKVSVRVTTLELGAKPTTLKLRAKAGGKAVTSPPIVLQTNATEPIEVSLGAPHDGSYTAEGEQAKALERLPFTAAMQPETLRLSARTPEAERTVRLVVRDIPPGTARGTYGCTLDAAAHGLSATLTLEVAVEPIRLWLEPAKVDLGKLVAGGRSRVGTVRVLTDSQQPVSVAVGVVGAAIDATARPTLTVLDKPLAVSANAPGTVKLQASASTRAKAGDHRFALTCRATEWEGTTADASVVARVAAPTYNVAPREVDFGTGLTGATVGPQTITVSSDAPAEEKVSVTWSKFEMKKGDRRLALGGAKPAAKPSADAVVAGKPLRLAMTLTLPRNYIVHPERGRIYDVVAEGTYTAVATIAVGGQPRAKLPLRVTVKRRARE